MQNYELIRSGRRSLALEVTRDCRVVVRAPQSLPQVQIDRFVDQHRDWIARHLERQRQRPLPPPPTAEEIALLKAKAREILPPRIAYWSQRMGVTPTGFRVTTARKRYGSCSAKNSLCFSCFLMNYPPEAIDLVVVHELCHIRVKHHGPAFYELLAQYLPDHQARKKLLSKESLP